MSSTPGVFKGCRFLLAAAKASTPKSPAVKTTAKPKTRSKSPSPKPRSSSSSEPRNTGIFKVSPVSPALRQFLGVPEAARTDAVKKVWDYVKLHNLQNPTNKREIYCDDKLKAIFEGRDSVWFLEVGSLLSRHFLKTN